VHLTLVNMNAGRLLRSATSALLAAALPLAAQEPEIVFGQSAGYTGRSASSVKELEQGARLWFDQLNKSGGIHGRKVYLNTLDDGYFPELTVKNTRQLIDEDKVFALFGYYGDASVKAILPLLAERKIPLIGPVSGSTSFRNPPNPWVFNVRAGLQTEVEKIVQQVTSMGQTRVAIFAQSDDLGQEATAALEQSLKRRHLSIAAAGTYERNTLNVDDAVDRVVPSRPQAVVMACTLEACASFVRKMRSRGAITQYVHVSTVEAQALIKELGIAGARGITVTQVVPMPTNQGVPVVREYQRLLLEAGAKAKPSFAGLEGFIAAKVAAEGLKRAGKNPTREKFMTALESLDHYDVGGFSVTYGPGVRLGSDYADITIIGRSGSTRY
jgi:branched-chain amino acid transport system substrate-binding protein